MTASYTLPSRAPKFRRDPRPALPANFRQAAVDAALERVASTENGRAWLESAARAEADGDRRGAARKRRIAAHCDRTAARDEILLSFFTAR